MLCVNLLTSLVWPSVYSVFMIIFIYLCTDRPGFPRPSQPPPSSSSSLVASCARISPCDLSSSSSLFFFMVAAVWRAKKMFWLWDFIYVIVVAVVFFFFLFFFKFRGTLKVDAGVMTFKWPLCHSNRWCNTTGSCFPASPLHHQQSQHIQQEQLHRSSLLPSGETLPPAATSRPLWPSQRWVPFSSNFSLCVAYLPSRTRCVCGWDTLGGVWAAAGVGAVPCGSTAGWISADDFAAATRFVCTRFIHTHTPLQRLAWYLTMWRRSVQRFLLHLIPPPAHTV